MQPSPSPQRGYRGGKAGAGVWQKIINQMPPHTVYIEPFLGHGAVLLHKRPAQDNIALDLDPKAVAVVRARLRHRQSENTCSTHGSGDASGGHSGSDGDAAVDIEGETARYRLRVGDALAFLRSYAFTGSELVYADPPYVRSTRRTRGRLYRYEMDDHQHTDLLALLRSLPCAVMVSGYRSALYGDRLGDWRTIEFQTMTRGGPATEVLWMNYPQPTDLHEYTYLGEDFREREKPKRQQKRWIRKLVAKSLLEQQALLIAQLTSVGPTVRTAVLRSVLAPSGDEDLIARSGTLGSPPAPGAGAADHRDLTRQDLVSPARASRCTICRSPARQRIDQALEAGVSLREVARQEGLSKSVVGRHRDHRLGGAVSHLPTCISGTAGTVRQQEQTPYADSPVTNNHKAMSEQLELLALDTVG